MKKFLVLTLALLLMTSCAPVKVQKPPETGTAPVISKHVTSSEKTVFPETTTPETTTEPMTTPPPTTLEPTTSLEPEPEPEFYSVSLLCAGDNLIHSSIFTQAKRRAEANGKDGYDFSYPYQKIERYLQSADLAILNQETIVTDMLEPSDYPRFCSPAALGEHMIDIGFDVFSMSNNHVLDQGEDGLLYALDFWDSHPDIVRYGAYRSEEDMQNIRIKEVNGITFAFLGYMEHTNGLFLAPDSELRLVYLSNLELIEQQIRRADELADVVVVSPHFGIEVTNEVTDNQRELARKFVEWGADLIIGTQPHTVQTMEYIKRGDGTKAFCFYCLGNLISSMDRPLAMVGMLGNITVTKNSLTGEITFDNIKAIPIINQYGASYYQVHVVPYAEYTDSDLSAHGCNGFDRSVIDSVLSNIPDEFLAIE